MKMKKSKWLLLLALISATLMCACGKKDVEEAPVPEARVINQVEESANDVVVSDVSVSENAQTVETTKTTSTIDYSCYDDLIKKIEKEIKDGLTREECERLDISDTFWYEPDSVETRGYLRRDLDGDGIEELILGRNDGGYNEIYDIYTTKDGELVHTVMGWERNRYYLCTNGALANEGSGGWNLSINAYYTYTGQMITAETTDGLIETVTYDGDRDANNPWFYCSTKDYAQDAEPITEERANEIMNSYVYETLEFITFQ